MQPDLYYPKDYLTDIERYKEASNNEFYDLCPLVLGDQLKNKKHTGYVSIKDFFTCQYCLNLISQAIHTYEIEHYESWQNNSEKYLNIQGCYAHSFGGGVSRPQDLIKFLKEYNIDIDKEKLFEYTNYFINVVLSEVVPKLLSNNLIDNLLLAQDCIEIHPCLQTIKEAR